MPQPDSDGITQTNTVVVRRERATYTVLDVLGERVSRLWNAANYLCRQAFIKNQPVPGYAKLCQLVPALCQTDFDALPSDIAQEVLKKLAEAWKVCFALQKRFKLGQLTHRPGLVRYRKFKDGSRPTDYIPVKSDRSYSLTNRQLALTLPVDLRQAGRLLLSIRGKLRFKGKAGRLELVYHPADRVWRATQSVQLPPRVIRQNGRVAGVDLGLRVCAALSIAGQSRATLFSGRELMKEFAYWTRRIAQHQATLAQRKRKTSQQLSRLYQKRQRRLGHALASIAHAIAGICRASGVTMVYIGWPKGIRDDVKVRKDWRGRLHNYWAFTLSGRLIIAALARYGILGQLTGERGTSSTCPWTGNPEHKLTRHPRWRLACKTCGKVMHSDAAGATNMFYQKIPGLSRDTVQATVWPRVQVWTSHTWARRHELRGQPRALAA